MKTVKRHLNSSGSKILNVKNVNNLFSVVASLIVICVIIITILIFVFKHDLRFIPTETKDCYLNVDSIIFKNDLLGELRAIKPLVVEKLLFDKELISLNNISNICEIYVQEFNHKLTSISDLISQIKITKENTKNNKPDFRIMFNVDVKQCISTMLKNWELSLKTNVNTSKGGIKNLITKNVKDPIVFELQNKNIKISNDYLSDFIHNVDQQHFVISRVLHRDVNLPTLGIIDQIVPKFSAQFKTLQIKISKGLVDIRDEPYMFCKNQKENNKLDLIENKLNAKLSTLPISISHIIHFLNDIVSNWSEFNTFLRYKPISITHPLSANNVLGVIVKRNRRLFYDFIYVVGGSVSIIQNNYYNVGGYFNTIDEINTDLENLKSDINKIFDDDISLIETPFNTLLETISGN